MSQSIIISFSSLSSLTEQIESSFVVQFEGFVEILLELHVYSAQLEM